MSLLQHLGQQGIPGGRRGTRQRGGTCLLLMSPAESSFPCSPTGVGLELLWSAPYSYTSRDSGSRGWMRWEMGGNVPLSIEGKGEVPRVVQSLPALGLKMSPVAASRTRSESGV